MPHDLNHTCRHATHPTATLALVACVAAAVGCGGGREAATEAPPRARSTASTEAPAVTARRPLAPPAVCRTLGVTEVGTVSSTEAPELSGLALSPGQPGVLWAVNDSGDRARVLALAPGGRLLADLVVPGADAVDWEDLAVGPDLARGGRARALYVADIGDNRSVRAAIDVYVIAEPRLPATGGTAPAARLRLRYPEGARDAETLLVEPETGEIAIVSKRLSGESEVYVTGPWSAASGGERTLRRVAGLRFGLGGMATAGDVSADGRTVVVRTYTGFFAWAKRPGSTLAATLRRKPCTGKTSFAGERQGEALALTAGGRAFYTVSEGVGTAVRRYAVSR